MPYSTDVEQERQRKILMESLGDALTAWANVEMFLRMAFEDLVETKPGVAELIWDSVISFEAKIKALNAVYNHLVKDAELLLIWKKLVNKIIAASKKRNEMVHSTLVLLGRDERACIIPYYSSVNRNQRHRLFHTDVAERALRFRQIVDAIIWIMARTLDPDRDSKPIDLEEAPDLILRLQKSDGQNP
jgi:hypothetical protein